MAASFTMTRNQIIKKALERIQAIAEGDTITSEMYNSAAEDLNLVNVNLNRFRNKLWTIVEDSVALSTPDAVSNNDVDYYCILPHTSAADNEPGVGDNWELYWYAGSVDVSTNPDSWALDTAYDNGATVELPTDAISLESAFLRYQDDDTEVVIINRFQENAILSKWETGEPCLARFERYTSPPKIELYYKPDQTGYRLFYTYLRKLSDITEQGATPDVPAEWLDYLIYALAYKQSHVFGVDVETRNEMKREAILQLKSNIRDQQEDTEHECLEPCY